ncbi:NAD-dependent epimerase/dehydratase family protein [Flavobacterium piscinae]|uniref:NAD-dependent epimerase/dehydratase family protein n=1 Tax=Flavobacterium piscinae TaxID=2506424 RepID=UPI002AAA9BEA|nr:NAD-dependent epimerase/dehydratase family protein [Flavobacterium piscinae]
MNLVTGGTGLVGAHLLLHLLQKGEKVRALFRNEKSILKTKKLFNQLNYSDLFYQIEWFTGNVNDIPSLELAFKNIDYVYHCAALISFDSVEEENLRKINIEGTANMVNCSLAFGVKKFCYVSSILCLG